MQLPIMLVVLMLLLPATAAQPYDLSNYPSPFIKDGKVVAAIGVGNITGDDAIAAADILTTLRFNDQYENGSETFIASEKGLEVVHGIMHVEDDYFTSRRPGIIIGGPCANPATAVLLNKSRSWPECAEGFEEGVGVAMLLLGDDVPYLVIAGYNGADTRRAAHMVSFYRKYELKGGIMHALK